MVRLAIFWSAMATRKSLAAQLYAEYQKAKRQRQREQRQFEVQQQRLAAQMEREEEQRRRQAAQATQTRQREQERADRLEAELRALNELVRTQYVEKLATATQTIGEALTVLRRTP